MNDKGARCLNDEARVRWHDRYEAERQAYWARNGGEPKSPAPIKPIHRRKTRR